LQRSHKKLQSRSCTHTHIARTQHAHKHTHPHKARKPAQMRTHLGKCHDFILIKSSTVVCVVMMEFCAHHGLVRGPWCRLLCLLLMTITCVCVRVRVRACVRVMCVFYYVKTPEDEKRDSPKAYWKRLFVLLTYPEAEPAALLL